MMWNLSDISSHKVLHNRFVLLLFLSGQRDLVLSVFILMSASTLVMMMVVMMKMVFTFTDMARCLRSRLVFPVQQRNRK